MLTPAISVVSAIEGLKVISPSLSHWVLPITVCILLGLFSLQSLGSQKIGFIFGPVILIWFVVLALLGMQQIILNPSVLMAINPYYAWDLMRTQGLVGYSLLGGVFLVVTGGEALYADIGHFGKRAIRLGWFFIVLPALLINYFGQAAYLLEHPAALVNPFYLLSPSWFSVPLLILATLATIIASQAVITATFSLIKQAVLLGFYPHLRIVQTSAAARGQVYIPQVNFILAVGTLLLILFFRSSNTLAHAYGIAVNLDMLLASILIAFAAYKIWQWSLLAVISVFSIFIFMDLFFLGANAEKLLTGAWVPVVFALCCAFIMYTWKAGMRFLRQTYYLKKSNLPKMLAQLTGKNVIQLPEVTAIFITDIYDQSGSSLLHFLKFSHAMPEHILIVSYAVKTVPYVDVTERFDFECLNQTTCKMILNYGFMDFISIPNDLAIANEKKILPFQFDINTATYLVEIPTVLALERKKTLWFFWQEKLFAFLTRNYSANLNIEFYHLPYNRTLAIGAYRVL